MNDTFFWQGKPIEDINQWCKERDIKLVHYKASRIEVDFFGGGPQVVTKEGIMPDPFWETLMMSNGWSYELINRMDPT